MEYGVNYILVKSNWFDPHQDKTKMSKIKSEGLLTYLTLFKFKLFDFDKNNNRFVLSINMLSKEIPNRLKLSKDDICEIIRHLQREKVINITNVSNWKSQMYKIVEDKNEGYKRVLDFDRVLVIDAIDYPQTTSSNETGKWIDKPASDNDFYIAVHAPMIDEYLHKFKFDEKYIVLLVIMQKYHRTTNGFYMSMEKMEHVTGIGKNIINRMTWKLYEEKLLAAYKKDNGKGESYHEYYICQRYDGDHHKGFLSSHEENINSWVKKLKVKRDQQTKKDDVKAEAGKVENKLPRSNDIVKSLVDVPVDSKSKHAWGKPSPFENVDDSHVTNNKIEEELDDRELFC